MGAHPRHVLGGLPLAQQKPLKGIVSCTVAETCSEALRKTAEAKVMCLPVYSASDPSEVVGVIDMIDIVGLIATLHPQPDAHGWEAWNQAKVEAALNPKRRLPPMVSSQGTYLQAAVIMFDTQLHRVFVRNEKLDIVNVVTQTDMVKVLHSHMDLIDPLYLSLQVCMFQHFKTHAASEMLTAAAAAPAMDAFRLIYTHAVTAVPVVDAEGKPVGNISARDIRYAVADADFPSSLYKLSCLDFCTKLRQQQGPNPPPGFVSLVPTSSVRDVIETLHLNRIHRVWLLDQQGRVTHALSIADVLRDMVHH